LSGAAHPPAATRGTTLSSSRRCGLRFSKAKIGRRILYRVQPIAEAHNRSSTVSPTEVAMGKTKLRIALAALMAPLIAPFHATPASDDDFSRERQRMVAEIAVMAQSTKRETGRERFTDRVMDAMEKVPRHRFVAETAARSAY